MIALLRSTDGNPDSRFEKYVSYLDNFRIPHISVCWDRFCCKKNTKDTLYYKHAAKYGNGVKNLMGLIGFNIFILKTLVARRSDYQVIHAADFDTVLPAIFMKIFYGKKVIYDIYDWYIDSRKIENCIVKKLMLFLEHFVILKSDVVIICEQGRRSQIKFEPRRLWILPNIPHLYVEQNSNFNNNDKLTVSYVGILSGDRGLQNLIKLAKSHNDINFIVAGFGPLEDYLTEAAIELTNLEFRGRVSYQDALRIMQSSDLIYAMYERQNPNHIYAAPNKFYEGLALGKPIITTVGTLVGDSVQTYDTGYCIDESYYSLEKLIRNFNMEIYQTKCENATKLWKDKFSEYTSTFMRDKYKSFIYDVCK